MKYKRYGKNFRRPSEVNRKWTDCDTCGGLGYFETNQSKGHMGISSCNACKLFEDDLEAQLFVMSLLDIFKIDWTWKYSHLYPAYDTIGHKKKARAI